MKKRVVNWTWEDPDSQDAFAQLVGFPDQQQTMTQVDQIEALMRLKPAAAILDVGCGTGRQAIELARRGYTVTGIDVARRYLEQAKEAAARQGVRVAFRLQRGSELSDEASFDLALAFWHTLGFMSDSEIGKHFQGISRALKPLGRLLLVLADPKLVPGATTEHTNEWTENEGRFILTERHFEDGTRYERCIVLDTVKEEIVEYHEMHRAFSLTDVQKMLQRAGFGPARCLRDLEGHPATPEEFGVFICAAGGSVSDGLPLPTGNMA